MAISLKHKFQSIVPDQPNPGLVRPSNWNDEHDLTLSSGVLVGRTSPGDGPAESIPVDSFATAAQGEKADTAVQPGVLAAVATTGSYSDLSGKPTQREVLTANRNYYVRTDGSDSNNGLTNNSGGAFLTQQKAIDIVAALDLSIYNVTIFCGPGTRTAPVTLKKLTGSGTASLEGDVTTPSNCTQSVTGGQCFTMEPGAIWKMRGFKLSTTTSGYPISCSAVGCELTLDGNMEYGAAASYHIVVSTGGSCKMTSSYTISASATNHILVQTGGILFYTPGAVTLSGSPAWSAAFISVTSGGLVTTASATFTGAATGKRFDVTLNGVINTFGGGANYFPGNVAGTATTGQYA